MFIFNKLPLRREPHPLVATNFLCSFGYLRAFVFIQLQLGQWHKRFPRVENQPHDRLTLFAKVFVFEFGKTEVQHTKVILIRWILLTNASVSTKLITVTF